jgi:ATP-dependent Clp protease adapter protein ClpS
VDAWLALVGLSLGVVGAWSTVRRALPRQESTLTIALTVAALEAARRAQGPVSPAHLAHAAVFALERDDGPDLSPVREAIEAHLDALPPGHVPADAPLGRAVMRAIQAAAAAAEHEATLLTLRAVLEGLRADRHVASLLEATERPPPSRPSGRLGAPYRAVSTPDVVHVLLKNDDVSTMEGVLAILRECFAKGNAEALHLMLTTHYEGSAIVGRYPRMEAEALRARACRKARDLGMPLAIELATDTERESPPRPTWVDRVRRLFTPDPSP